MRCAPLALRHISLIVVQHEQMPKHHPGWPRCHRHHHDAVHTTNSSIKCLTSALHGDCTVFSFSTVTIVGFISLRIIQCMLRYTYHHFFTIRQTNESFPCSVLSVLVGIVCVTFSVGVGGGGGGDVRNLCSSASSASFFFCTTFKRANKSCSSCSRNTFCWDATAISRSGEN